MIEAKDLTKRYGDTLAVDDLSFTVHPGVVTGFQGPNGPGKSTTMRLIMGLDAPNGGTSPSTAVMSTTCPGLCPRSAPSWSPGPSTPGEVPRLTCRCWQRRTPSRDPGLTRCWR